MLQSLVGTGTWRIYYVEFRKSACLGVGKGLPMASSPKHSASSARAC